MSLQIGREEATCKRNNTQLQSMSPWKFQQVAPSASQYRNKLNYSLELRWRPQTDVLRGDGNSYLLEKTQLATPGRQKPGRNSLFFAKHNSMAPSRIKTQRECYSWQPVDPQADQIFKQKITKIKLRGFNNKFLR